MSMRVDGSSQTQTTEKKKASQSTPEDQALHDSASVFTKNMLSGDVEGALKGVNQVIQKSMISAVKSAVKNFLKMLLSGNDAADAAKDATQTTTQIGVRSKKLIEVQEKVLDAGINALQELLTTGQIDMETYAANLTQEALKAGMQNEEAMQKADEQKELKTRNDEILAQLKEAGINIETDKESNEVIVKDKDGNETSVKGMKVKHDNKEIDVEALLAEYQGNNTKIASLGENIQEVVNLNEEIADRVSTGITDIALKGKDLGTVMKEQASELIHEGASKISQELQESIGLFQADAVTGFSNGAVDKAASTASVGLAASNPLSSGTILANGVADGAASFVRDATGSEALGAIVSGMAAGKSLAAVMSNVITNQASNFIDGQIDQLATNLTDAMFETNDTLTAQTAELKQANLVKEEDKEEGKA